MSSGSYSTPRTATRKKMESRRYAALYFEQSAKAQQALQFHNSWLVYLPLATKHKVIANMTVGKDVSMLFTDIVNCMQTGDIGLKKLVYLYLINYAKSNPDLAILAVNTFVKVSGLPKLACHLNFSCVHRMPMIPAL